MLELRTSLSKVQMFLLLATELDRQGSKILSPDFRARRGHSFFSGAAIRLEFFREPSRNGARRKAG
jgi:hypothetical protein